MRNGGQRVLCGHRFGGHPCRRGCSHDVKLSLRDLSLLQVGGSYCRPQSSKLLGDSGQRQ
jgi:hypothetical protein